MLFLSVVEYDPDSPGSPGLPGDASDIEVE